MQGQNTDLFLDASLKDFVYESVWVNHIVDTGYAYEIKL